MLYTGSSHHIKRIREQGCERENYTPQQREGATSSIFGVSMTIAVWQDGKSPEISKPRSSRGTIQENQYLNSRQ